MSIVRQDYGSIYDPHAESLIAPIQETLVADRAYAVGECFILDGVMYKVIQPITQGSTIVIGTDCEVAPSVTEQMYYKAGDTINIPSVCYYMGFVNSTLTTIYIIVPVYKPIIATSASYIDTDSLNELRIRRTIALTSDNRAYVDFTKSNLNIIYDSIIEGIGVRLKITKKDGTNFTQFVSQEVLNATSLAGTITFS